MPANSDPGATVNWYITNEGELVINPEDDSAYESSSLDKGTIDTSQYYRVTDSNPCPWYDYKSNISSVKIGSTTTPLDTSDWFYKFSNVKSMDLSLLDMSKVTCTSHMFEGCSSLSKVPEFLNGSTEALTNTYFMFNECTSLSDISSLSGWNTKSVTNTVEMFAKCTSLSDISSLSGWDTSLVSSMGSMFRDCSSLTDISSLSGWNTSLVSDMSYMFYHCDLLDKVDLSRWIISSVTNISDMFYYCSGLKVINLYNWSPSPSCNANELFYGCSNLNTIYCDNSWNCTGDLFSSNFKLVSKSSGKSYSLSQRDTTMANPDTGYFTYVPVSYSLSIPVEINATHSQLDNPELVNFTIEGKSDSCPLPSETTASMDDTNNVTFSEILFYKPDTYNYTITENLPLEMSTDKESHELSITIGKMES